jgi:hypothetical protein
MVFGTDPVECLNSKRVSNHTLAGGRMTLLSPFAQPSASHIHELRLKIAFFITRRSSPE